MKVHHIAEAPLRIKLGSANNSRAHAFLKDVEEISQPHPFNNKKRIIGGAAVEMSPTYGKNEIHIHDVLSLEPNKGHATRAIRLLQKLATKHVVVIGLFAKAYSQSPGHITDTEQLIRWYQKLGFQLVDDPDNIDLDYGAEMRYYP